MSQRLTPQWTKTSAEVFGENGHIGDEGEQIGLQILKEIFGDEVQHHPSNQHKQIKGHDYTVRGQGIDIKTNWHGDSVIVDYAKIWTTKATVWMHLNLETHEFIVYKTNDMQKYLENISPTKTKRGILYFVDNDLEFYIS